MKKFNVSIIGICILLLLVSIAGTVSAVEITLSTHQVNPGDTIYINTEGLYDGSTVSMFWEVFVDQIVTGEYSWEIRNLTFPINLDAANFKITNQNTLTNRVTLQNDVPDYEYRELILSGDSVNGIWSKSYGNDFINGTWPLIKDEGILQPGKTTLLSLLQWDGIKRNTTRVPSQVNGGPDDFTIPLTFYGINNGYVKVSIYVNGNLVLDDKVTIGSPISKTGNIYISTMPSGASVFVDGIYYGTTPQLVRDVPPGIRHVTLTKEGYSPYERAVNVKAYRVVVLASIRLYGTESSISLSSIPWNANVYLDGGFAGLSPITITGVEPGQHTLVVNKTGYRNYTTTVTVADGKPVRMGVIQLWSENFPFIGGLKTTDNTGGDIVTSSSMAGMFERLPDSRIQVVLDSGKLKNYEYT